MGGREGGREGGTEGEGERGTCISRMLSIMGEQE